MKSVPAPRRRAPHPTEGSAFARAVPRWANDLTGGELSDEIVSELERVQAQLLSFSAVYDRFLDRDASRWTNPGELIALLTEVQIGLASFFDARHPFWRDYRALVRQQVESARWEITGRGHRPPRFDAALVRALGRKLSLLRWPASAVPRLAGQPAEIARLDRLFDRFFRVLQLLDDMTDIDRDRQDGQINAVLCAATPLPGQERPELSVALGIARVCQVARADLGLILRRARGRCEELANVCVELDGSCRRAEEHAGRLAAYCLTASALDRVVAALA